MVILYHALAFDWLIKIENGQILHAVELYNFSYYHYHTAVQLPIQRTSINLEMNFAEIRTILSCTPHLEKLGKNTG